MMAPVLTTPYPHSVSSVQCIAVLSSCPKPFFSKSKSGDSWGLRKDLQRPPDILRNRLRFQIVFFSCKWWPKAFLCPALSLVFRYVILHAKGSSCIIWRTALHMMQPVQQISKHKTQESLSEITRKTKLEIWIVCHAGSQNKLLMPNIIYDVLTYLYTVCSSVQQPS